MLILLLIMSLASWYVMLTKLWDQRKLKKAARVVEKQFWTAPSVKDGVDRLKKGDDFRGIAEDGLRAASHHDGRLTDRIDLNEWITMSLQRSTDQVNSKLNNGLGLLATVGSTAPFVGLFGTVWGILNALVGIGIAGQASIDKVAGPVGEALIMTAHRLVRGRAGGDGLQLAPRAQQAPAGCAAELRQRPACLSGRVVRAWRAVECVRRRPRLRRSASK